MAEEYSLGDFEKLPKTPAPSDASKLYDFVVGKKGDTKPDHGPEEYSPEDFKNLPKPNEGISLSSTQPLLNYNGKSYPIAAPMIVGPQSVAAIEAAGPAMVSTIKELASKFGGEKLAELPSLLKLSGGGVAYEAGKHAIGAIGRKLGFIKGEH